MNSQITKPKPSSPITKKETADKQPWQKPQLQKLRVSLDTAVGFGSGPDLMSSTRFS